MELVKLFAYNGNNITFKNANGITYVNATEMAKPFGRLPKDYLKSQQAQELIFAISKRTNILLGDLVMTVKGGNAAGTWMHEDIALDFAQWLSIDFRLWCNDKLKEVITNGVQSKLPTMKEMAQYVLDAENAKEDAERQLAIQQPRFEYATNVLKSDKCITANELAMDFGWTANKLNKILYEKGIQYPQAGRWVLYAKFRSLGYAKNHTELIKGHPITFLVWAQIGRAFVHSLINPVMINSIKQKNDFVSQSILNH